MKILKNCGIIDVNAQRVLERRAVLIDGPQIARIGDMDTFAILEKELPPQSVFDLEGKLVMPGLIDAHVHLCVVQTPPDSDILLENLRASEALKVLYGAKHAKETLEAGFTTVRDLGGGNSIALRDAIGRDIIPGPRIVACGCLGQTAGQQERVMSEWSYDVPARADSVGVDGPWAVRKKVRELVGRGVDCIKVFASGEGFIRQPFDPYWREGRNYTLKELRALVDEAHAAGRRIACHAWVSVEGIKNAIAAGVDTIEHGVILDEEDVREMRERGMTYVPTLAVVNQMWNVDAAKGALLDGNGDAGGYAESRIEKVDAERYLEAHTASFRLALKSGVKIAMGSDTFRVLKQGENACELEWMVTSGMSEMEVLVSATKTSAEALGIENLVGSVEEGKLADLLVVDPSPLGDISVLRDRANLKMIVKNGEIVSAQ